MVQIKETAVKIEEKVKEKRKRGNLETTSGRNTERMRKRRKWRTMTERRTGGEYSSGLQVEIWRSVWLEEAAGWRDDGAMMNDGWWTPEAQSCCVCGSARWSSDLWFNTNFQLTVMSPWSTNHLFTDVSAMTFLKCPEDFGWKWHRCASLNSSGSVQSCMKTTSVEDRWERWTDSLLITSGELWTIWPLVINKFWFLLKTTLNTPIR